MRILALLLLALGIQVHYSLNSASRYLKFASPAELVYLMPVFWVGFNLLMFAGAHLVKRIGPSDRSSVANGRGNSTTSISTSVPRRSRSPPT